MRQYQYTVTPVRHQPQWPEEPLPISYPWGKGMLAVAVLAFWFAVGVDLGYIALLLGGVL